MLALIWTPVGGPRRSAFAMLAATTSARIRSACNADPLTSIVPNRFMFSHLPGEGRRSSLLVFVDGVHDAREFVFSNSTPVRNWSCASAIFMPSRSIKTLFPSGRSSRFRHLSELRRWIRPDSAASLLIGGNRATVTFPQQNRIRWSGIPAYRCSPCSVLSPSVQERTDPDLGSAPRPSVSPFASLAPLEKSPQESLQEYFRGDPGCIRKPSLRIVEFDLFEVDPRSIFGKNPAPLQHMFQLAHVARARNERPDVPAPAP